MGWAEAKKKREEEDRIRFEQMEVPASRLTPSRHPHHPPHCPRPPPPPPSPSAPSPRRHRCSPRHRQALRAREAEKREAAAKLEREQAAEKRRKELARIQEYQDNVDFDRPGA